MTTLRLPLDSYDITLGVDLDLGVNADLRLDELDGDLATVSGAPMVTEAVRRRITTAPAGYSRLVKTDNNYATAIGLGYGSNLPKYLSNPMTMPELGDDVTSEIDQAVNRDPRVINGRSAITEANNIQASLAVALNYNLRDVDNLSGNRLAVGEFSVAGLSTSTVNSNYQLVIPISNV
jgi:hypothetical protein